MTLPRGEIEGGITPGRKYPVFETRFGKVGMMICYDGFFPEVARDFRDVGSSKPGRLPAKWHIELRLTIEAHDAVNLDER